jgi:hypothetical protein
MIAEDLYAYSRYLEFNPKNYGAFSINLARLYLSICSEVDVLAKMLALNWSCLSSSRRTVLLLRPVFRRQVTVPWLRNSSLLPFVFHHH